MTAKPPKVNTKILIFYIRPNGLSNINNISFRIIPWAIIITLGLGINQALVFINLRGFETIMANPAKAGDAKPWV
jgi:hypothetical protein